MAYLDMIPAAQARIRKAGDRAVKCEPSGLFLGLIFFLPTATPRVTVHPNGVHSTVRVVGRTR